MPALLHSAAHLPKEIAQICAELRPASGSKVQIHYRIDSYPRSKTSEVTKHASFFKEGSREQKKESVSAAHSGSPFINRTSGKREAFLLQVENGENTSRVEGR